MQKNLLRLVRLGTQWTVLAYYIHKATHPLLGALAVFAAYLTVQSLLFWQNTRQGGEPDGRQLTWLISGEVVGTLLLFWFAETHGVSGPALILISINSLPGIAILLNRRQPLPLLLTAAGFLAGCALTVRYEGPQAVPELLMTLMLLLFFAALGHLLHALNREKEQTQVLAEKIKGLAVLQERERLAREMHDSVAHQLTVLLVQVQTSRRLLSRAAHTQAEAGLVQAEETARAALTEVRRAVRALRPADLEGVTEPEALANLARQFTTRTGIPVQLQIAANLELAPAPLRTEAIYRITQECLTNAQRHGGATAITLELGERDGMLQLRVTNNGSVPAAVTPGFGLLSMQKRANELGGTVDVELDGAFAVRVRVPQSPLSPLGSASAYGLQREC